MPPLRAHKDDLPLLAEAFLEQLGARHGGALASAPRRRRSCGATTGPGGIAELRNALERALVMSRSEVISPRPICRRKVRGEVPARGCRRGGMEQGTRSSNPIREAKRRFEVTYWKRKLEEHKWNVSQTAAEIGSHRQSLQRKWRRTRGFKDRGKALLVEPVAVGSRGRVIRVVTPPWVCLSNDLRMDSAK